MTTPEWAPQVAITVDLAARTIAEQFPELAGLDVEPLDAGWDNAVLLVGGRWVFRFVHREIALDGSRRELAVLPGLTGLPLAVPQPRFVGRPTPEVPWPFWGGPHLPGVGLAESGLAPGRRGAVAVALGEFLRALHAPERVSPVLAALPVDPIGRSDPARQAGRAAERLAALDAAGHAPGALAASAGLRAAAAALAPGEGRVLVHGDLHPRHVLVDGERATAVIDWGDTAIGDPAVDLMIAWAGFDPPERELLLDAYGPVPADRRTRARATALAVCAALAQQAAADGAAGLLTEALAGIRRAATDS